MKSACFQLIPAYNFGFFATFISHLHVVIRLAFYRRDMKKHLVLSLLILHDMSKEAGLFSAEFKVLHSIVLLFTTRQ